MLNWHKKIVEQIKKVFWHTNEVKKRTVQQELDSIENLCRGRDPWIHLNDEKSSSMLGSLGDQMLRLVDLQDLIKEFLPADTEVDCEAKDGQKADDCDGKKEDKEKPVEVNPRRARNRANLYQIQCQRTENFLNKVIGDVIRTCR